MRQPIHAVQLAEVVFYLISKTKSKNKRERNQIINVGGDYILDYFEIIKLLKDSLNKQDNAKKCLVIKIPNRLFFIFISPIILFSPKNFAALSRVCANLSGFKKACEITNTFPKKFPFSEGL